MLKLHEAKRCGNKLQVDLDRGAEDPNSFETLQNVSYIDNMDEAHFLDADHEVSVLKNSYFSPHFLTNNVKKFTFLKI